MSDTTGIDGDLPRADRLRVLVVDDHTTFAELVVLALSGEPDLESVGSARDAAAARVLVERHRPDVVLMDVQLGDDDGLEVTADLVARHPGLRVVVLTAHGDGETMRRAAAAGACALLPKDGSLPDLLDTLRRSRPGGLQVHPALLQSVLARPAPQTVDGTRPTLTPREQSVLRLLAGGRDVQRIAQDLDISVNTCRGYVKSLLAKLDAHSQLEAVVAARDLGLLDAPRRR